MTFLAILLSYLLGSVPTGLWLGLRLRGIDIREHGSKNIGATNTLRVLGKGLGALALAGDMFKGLVAVVVFGGCAATWSHLPLACGVAAIMGHTASVFLKFKGGKGVATSAGVFLGLAPFPMLAALAVFAVVVWFTRMVSAASISAALAFVVAIFLLGGPVPMRVIAVLVAVVIVWRHRSNMQRILNGTENRF
jgi:glycerol-3-phosphate acyltransferase PlsY